MTILEAIFAGVENDTLFYYSCLLQVQIDSTDKISIKVKRVSCPPDCPNGFGLSAFGHTRYIANHMATHGHEIILTKIDKISLVRELIQSTIDNAINDEIVGGSIAILRLTKDGPQWVQNENICPDLASTPKR